MVERKLDNIQDLGRHAGVSNADSARAAQWHKGMMNLFKNLRFKISSGGI